MHYSMDNIESFLIGHQFNDLSSFVTIAEEALRLHMEVFKREIEREVSKKEERYRRDYEDFCDQEYQRISIQFPRRLFQSLLVTIWSEFDHKMTIYAQDWAMVIASSPEEGKKKAKGLRSFEAIKEFWTRQAFRYPDGWDVLDKIREVRNLIAHDNGRRHTTSGLIDPIELKCHERTRDVEAYVAERMQAGKMGLSFDGDELVVDADFCREMSEHCESFLQAMVKTMPKTDDSYLFKMMGWDHDSA